MNKKIFFSLLLILSANVFAQLDLPKLSPKSTISQNFGYTTVTIEYSRPDVRGRTIWGGLVPYEKVYRSGANEATTIELSTDAVINGNKIPAGKYSLFIIPSNKEWTVILNKTSKQWGAFNYDEKQDLLRFQVQAVPVNFMESLSFWISDLTINSVVVNFAWENLGFSFKIETDVMNMAHSKIKDALSKAKPDDWRVYSGSANFAAENNWFLDEALTWTDKAIEAGGTFYVYYIKAKLLFKKNNYKETVEWIAKAKEKGKDDKNYSNYAAEIDRLETEAKAKL